MALMIQVLLDHIRSTRNANIAIAGRLPSRLKSTLRRFIDEVESRPTRANPRIAFLVGKNVYRSRIGQPGHVGGVGNGAIGSR